MGQISQDENESCVCVSVSYPPGHVRLSELAICVHFNSSGSFTARAFERCCSSCHALYSVKGGGGQVSAALRQRRNILFERLIFPPREK